MKTDDTPRVNAEWINMKTGDIGIEVDFARRLEREVNDLQKQNEIKNPRWVDQGSSPAQAGWYYVRETNGSHGARYYDDSAKGSWFASSARDGWTPNNSFACWLLVPEIHA